MLWGVCVMVDDAKPDRIEVRCPKCEGPTRVLQSRESGRLTRRRRLCGLCGLRYTTMEVPVGYSTDLTVQITTEGLTVKKRGA